MWSRSQVGVVLLLLGMAGLGAEVRAQAVNTGRLAGQVRLSRDLTARHARFEPYEPRPGARAPQEAGAEPLRGSEFQNVVIYLESDRLTPSPTASRRHVMSQVGEQFVPGALPVVVGDSVEFPNRDPFYHNVFSLSRAKSFDLGRYPTDDSRVVQFDRPGVIKVFCHIHADMSAVILVLQNPYFTIPDEAGRFALENIPPGDYTAVAWHQRARRIETRVRILAGETLDMDFSIPVSDETDGE